MRHKTYLSQEEQWLRTLALYERWQWLSWYEPIDAQTGEPLGNAHYECKWRKRKAAYLWKMDSIGKVVRESRLFLKGDLVFVIDKGGSPRRRVLAISSKGRKVRNYRCQIDEGHAMIRTFSLSKELLQRDLRDKFLQEHLFKSVP